MNPKSFVITGGSRGIGLGLTQALLETEHMVIATSTEPTSAESLMELKENYPEHLTILGFKADEPEGPLQLAEDIGKVTSHVDVLVNNAGVFESCDLMDLRYNNVSEILKVNTVAPLILTKELSALLKKSNDAKVVNISSGMGSMEEFQWPENISYCVSKAGLNMVTKALSENLKSDGIPVVSVSPGWVRTDMGGDNADLSVEESVEDLLPFIESINMEMSGGFYRKNGDTVPW